MLYRPGPTTGRSRVQARSSNSYWHQQQRLHAGSCRLMSATLRRRRVSRTISALNTLLINNDSALRTDFQPFQSQTYYTSTRYSVVILSTLYPVFRLSVSHWLGPTQRCPQRSSSMWHYRPWHHSGGFDRPIRRTFYSTRLSHHCLNQLLTPPSPASQTL